MPVRRDEPRKTRNPPGKGGPVSRRTGDGSSSGRHDPPPKLRSTQPPFPGMAERCREIGRLPRGKPPRRLICFPINSRPPPLARGQQPKLDLVARQLWAAHGEGHLDDADAGHVADALQARRIALATHIARPSPKPASARRRPGAIGEWLRPSGEGVRKGGREGSNPQAVGRSDPDPGLSLDVSGAQGPAPELPTRDGPGFLRSSVNIRDRR